jgi:hypothetical protein
MLYDWQMPILYIGFQTPFLIGSLYAHVLDLTTTACIVDSSECSPPVCGVGLCIIWFRPLLVAMKSKEIKNVCGFNETY